MMARGETAALQRRRSKQSPYCESLRQKNTCLTQLWRELKVLSEPPKGKGRNIAVNSQVKGQRICSNDRF